MPIYKSKCGVEIITNIDLTDAHLAYYDALMPVFRKQGMLTIIEDSESLLVYLEKKKTVKDYIDQYEII